MIFRTLNRTLSRTRWLQSRWIATTTAATTNDIPISSVPLAFLGITLSLGAGSVIYAASPSTPSPSSDTPSPTTPVSILALDSDDEAHLVNWSRTHEAHPKHLYQPDSVEELTSLVQYAHRTGRKLRPCGTFLSPNGIATGEDMMVSLAGIDKIKNINLCDQEVTVEAGIVVDVLLKELAKLGLTLANFSSIKEQQMGGWTQVAAHGTGATLPTVDEMITSMKLLTPALGIMELSNDQNPELFKLARVGLGSLGIVTELTLTCVPIHQLLEKTYVVHGVENVRAKHAELLQMYRHVRYMWIPGTDMCVVVVSNPTPNESHHQQDSGDDDDGFVPALQDDVSRNVPEEKNEKNDSSKQLRSLLMEIQPDMDISITKSMSFSQLRDQLLAHAPLDREWVQRVNNAEALFWQGEEGERVGWSDEILGFDCGGSQWVFEVCIPTGTLAAPNGSDIDFVTNLQHDLQKAELPAPAPIEQRWTASSTSPMSPAYSENHDEIFSWVGGIMYIPNENDREEINQTFQKYMNVMNKLSSKYGGHAHWAKIELPHEDDIDYFLNLMKMRRRLREKYPVDAFNRARGKLDPKGVLSNHLIDKLFGTGV